MEIENFEMDKVTDIIIQLDQETHKKYGDVLAVRGFDHARDTIGYKGKNNSDRWRYMYIYDRKSRLLVIKLTLITKPEITQLLLYLFGRIGNYSEPGMSQLSAYLISERPGQWPAKFKSRRGRDLVDITLFFTLCMLLIVEEDYSGNICRGECLMGGHRHNIIYDHMIEETKQYADDIVAHYGKNDGKYIRLIHDVIDRKMKRISDTLSTDILRDPYIYSNFAVEAYIDRDEPWYLGRSREIKNIISSRNGDDYGLVRMVKTDICNNIGTENLKCLGIGNSINSLNAHL